MLHFKQRLGGKAHMHLLAVRKHWRGHGHLRAHRHLVDSDLVFHIWLHCKNPFHREGRDTCPGGQCQGEREEKLKNLNIRVENLQENLRDFKLSFAAFVSSR
jgi:hypothetical protein